MIHQLSCEELGAYLQAEKHRIIVGHGSYTEETIRKFITNEAESFHEKYFKEHGFDD